MSKNLGKVDRVLRVIIGAALISLVFVGPETPWGWVGLLPLITGLVGYCPAYAPFGFNTLGSTARLSANGGTISELIGGHFEPLQKWVE